MTKGINKARKFFNSPFGLVVIGIIIAVILGAFVIFSSKFSKDRLPLAFATPTPVDMNSVLYPTNNPAFVTSVLSFVKNSDNNGVSIMLNTGGQQVSGVQMVISYDPQVLTNVSVSPETFFTNPVILQNTVDQTKGIISYTLALNPGDSPRQGNNAVADIRYTKLKGTPPTALSFLPQTTVTMEGVNTSVLKSTSSIQIQ